jgi:hypothetical protein
MLPSFRYRGHVPGAIEALARTSRAVPIQRGPDRPMFGDRPPGWKAPMDPSPAERDHLATIRGPSAGTKVPVATGHRRLPSP